LRTHWLIALLALGVGVACDGAPGADAGQEAPAVAEQTTAEVAGTNGDEASSSVVYVDVRTPEEYAAGHVEGAINIPHTEMAQRYDELEQYDEKELVLYCRSGRRSGIALGILEDVGFDNVTNAGGLSDLQARGVPTTR